MEAFLVDYGQNLHRIQYPQGVSYLIDDLEKIDPIAFKFSLNGKIQFKFFLYLFYKVAFFRSDSGQKDV